MDIVLFRTYMATTTSWPGNTFRIIGPLMRRIHHWSADSDHYWSVTRSVNASLCVNVNRLLNKQLSSWCVGPRRSSCNVTVMQRVKVGAESQKGQKRDSNPGIILSMGSASDRRRCFVTSSLTGWAHAQNDLCNLPTSGDLVSSQTRYLTHWALGGALIISNQPFSNSHQGYTFWTFPAELPQGPIDDLSTLVHVMAWCRQAAGHYLN